MKNSVARNGHFSILNHLGPKLTVRSDDYSIIYCQ